MGGCGHYRMKFPAMCAQTMRRDIRIVESTKMIPLPEFYRDIRMVRVQRQVSDVQCEFLLKFLKPLSLKYGFWLCYEIDDVIGPDDIPMYNMGRDSYQQPSFKKNIKTMLNAVDYVTVTTEELKKYYHETFEVPNENIIVIPNYLPRWWIGEAYDTDRIANRFDENKRKRHRIAIASSTTHFDVNGKNGYVDDFTHIVDFIKSTINKYEWVFIGGVPHGLKQEAQERKIEVHRGSDLLNYPRELSQKNIDVVVAPLLDNVFNRCKSNIKFLEMSALGIPCICQDLIPYQPYTDLLFNDANELQNQIDRVLSKKKDYMNVVKENRHIIDFGNPVSPNGWWLEKNMGLWIQQFMIQQKTLCYDVRPKTVEANQQALKKHQEEVVFNRGAK
jgi:hypothetical protein